MTLTKILKNLKKDNVNIFRGGKIIAKFLHKYEGFDEYLDTFIKLFPVFETKGEVLSWIITKRKIGKCLICGKRIPYVHKSPKRCFCSNECKSSKNANIIIQERAKNAIFEKYGSAGCANSKEVRDKYKKTCLERYGVENVFQLKEVKEKSKQTNLTKYGTEHCSQNNDYKETVRKKCLERYGVESIFSREDIKQKIKNTCLKRYGVEYISQHKDFKENIKKTCLEKYGVENVFQDSEIKQKIKETCLKRYGVENVFQNSQIKQKIKETCLEKYGVDSYSKLQNHKSHMYKKSRNLYYSKLINRLKLVNLEPLFTREEYKKCSDLYDFKCIVCETTFCGDVDDGKLPNCPKCNPPIKSRGEDELTKYIEELTNYIEELSPNIITNDRNIIKPLELDIYIPNKHIAIEYNGLYWHSNLFKDYNYHLNKTKSCEKVGIRLIHIFEDEWINKQDIVKNRLKHILGYNSDKIYARKCEIRNVNSKNCIEFLNKYHIQGFIYSTINYGLYYQDELVSLMTFGKSRFNKNYNYELLRYCTLPDKSIIGGASKLLSHFKNDYKGSIISYADKRWSNGNLYKQLGFKELKDSKPSYYYFNNKERFSRIKFQKYKLKELFPDTYSDDKTEFEIMMDNGFLRIHDCGNKVFLLE